MSKMADQLTNHRKKLSCIILILGLFCCVRAEQKAQKIPEDDPKRVQQKKEFLKMGIVYTRGMWESGASEFLRENYAEPYWNRSTHEIIGSEVVNEKLVDKKYQFHIHKGVSPRLRNLDAYTLEVLDQLYKNRLIQMAIRTYDDQKDRLRTVDSSIVSRTKCHAHLDYLILEAKRWRMFSETGNFKYGRLLDPEVGSFFDSYAREEPGLLTGNTIWVGQPSECQQRRVFDLRPINKAMPTKFNGRYCIASIKSKNWTELIKQKEAKLTAMNYWKYPDQEREYRKAMSLQIGFCLPDSCDTSTLLRERIEDLHFLATLRLGHPWKNYAIEDLWCVPDANSEFMKFSQATKYLIALFISVFLICLLATFLDGPDDRQTSDVADRTLGQKLISCFSFSRNWTRLMATRKEDKQSEEQAEKPTGPNPLDLSFLDFFKVISMLAVIMAHVGSFLFQFSKNGLQFTEVGEGYYVYALIGLAYFVDYFFVISGIITAYVVFSTRMVEKFNTFQWLYTIFHRWVRLGPPFLLVSWFSRSLLRHLGHGPYWDYGTTRMTFRKRCMESSYAWPALMITNFHHFFEECLNPSWYVSSDMQFYLLTPVILIALYKFARATYVGSAMAILACIYARYQIYLTDPSIRHLELSRMRQDCYMRNSWDSYHLYVQPQHRFPTYLMGLLAGHYLYMVRSGQWKSWMYNVEGGPLSAGARLGRRFLAFFCAIMCFVVLQGPRILDSKGQGIKDPSEIKEFIAQGYASQYVNGGFFIMMVFVFIFLGEFKKFKKFCELPQWTIISKFNYFVLLIHVEIIYIWILNSPNLEIQTMRQVVGLFIVTVVSSYLASAVLTLMFEMPIAQFERQFVARLFISGKSHKNKKNLVEDFKNSKEKAQ